MYRFLYYDIFIVIETQMFNDNILNCKLINWSTWKMWVCYSISRVWLFATPGTVACQAPLSMEFSKARILEIAISFSRGSSEPRNWTHLSVAPACMQILYRWDTGNSSILSTPLTILSCLYLHSLYIIYEWLAYCLVKQSMWLCLS